MSSKPHVLHVIVTLLLALLATGIAVGVYYQHSASLAKRRAAEAAERALEDDPFGPSILEEAQAVGPGVPGLSAPDTIPPPGAPDASPPPGSAPTGSSLRKQNLRPLDREVFARLEQGIKGEKLRDALPHRCKVNLYSDAKDGRVNRVKLDLDRDGLWDEKWEIRRAEGLEIGRAVSTLDDNTHYDRIYRLRAGVWVEAP